MIALSSTGLPRLFALIERSGNSRRVQGLFHRRHGETRAVDDISFQISEGDFVGFLGPNGAGKTTTLKMLSGLLHPTSGSATVLGFVPWSARMP
jgi:ABC-2 type transport system ATP-binding protein